MMTDEQLRLEALRFALQDSDKRLKRPSAESIVAVAEVFYEFIVTGYDYEDGSVDPEDDGGGQELPIPNDNKVTKIAAMSIH